MELIVQRALSGSSREGKSVFEAMNEKCVENIEKALSFPDFEDKIKACRSTMERVELVYRFFEWIPFDQKILSEVKKNGAVSEALREEANAYYKMKMLDAALRGYTLAIMFAPPKSEALGLSFANRSAVLYAMGKYEACREDIESALVNGYPNSMKAKLDARIAKCEALRENNSETTAYVKIEKDKRRKFCEGILFRVKKPNFNLPSAEEFVRMEEEEGRGRKLVVTRDIPAGTVLIVEKPFASVLSNILKWVTDRCQHCMRKMINGIPCSSCTFGLYCSQACRDAAAGDFHHDECGTLAHLHCASTPRYVLLAFRIILKLGAEKIGKIWRMAGSENSGDGRGDELGSDDEAYRRIASLVSHSDKLNPMELYSNTLHALGLISVLDEYSDFFKRTSKDRVKQKEMMRYAAATLTLHLENIPCNSISLDEVHGLESLSLEDSLTRMSPEDVKMIIQRIQYKQYGAGVYGITSLINHSCDPNVTRINGLDNGMLAVVATRSLIMGEEICTCYSRYFANDEREERIKYLEDSYYFSCNCIACKFNWPQLSQLLLVKNISYCCNKCSKAFKREDKNSQTQFSRCLLKGKKKLSCSMCSAVYNQADVQSELLRNIDTFFQACHLVTTNMPLEGIRLLFNVSKYFDNTICPPYAKSSMTQDVFKHALELIVHYS